MELFLSCSLTLIIDLIMKWGGTMAKKLSGFKRNVAEFVKTMGIVLAEDALLAKAL